RMSSSSWWKPAVCLNRSSKSAPGYFASRAIASSIGFARSARSRCPAHRRPAGTRTTTIGWNRRSPASTAGRKPPLRAPYCWRRSRLHWMSCPPVSATYSSPTNWRGRASRTWPLEAASTSTPCWDGKDAPSCICAPGCNRCTTNFFEEETKMLRIFLGDRLGRKTGRFAMALVMVVGIAAMGGLVMLLWNWLMPALFAGVRQVDYWQALGLLLLSKLLFGGGRGHWKGRRQHWESLSQEEREQLKNHFKNRWSDRFGID